MLYTNFNVGSDEYKLRLTTKALVDLEKKLGTNPLNVLMEVGNSNQLPPIGTLLLILHASMQKYQHGITVDDVYDIYDKYIEEGHSLVDLLQVINDVLMDSGIVPKVEDEEPVKNYKIVEKK